MGTYSELVRMQRSHAVQYKIYPCSITIFQIAILSSASLVNKARLLSVSVPHAGVWISGAPAFPECRKHEANDMLCQELRWTCDSLAVETFEHWGKEAQSVFMRLYTAVETSEYVQQYFPPSLHPTCKQRNVGVRLLFP